MVRQTSSAMGLGPPICLKCMVIGTLDNHPWNHKWECPRCHDTALKGSFFLLDQHVQKVVEYRTKLVEERMGRQTPLFVNNAHTSIRAFMLEPGYEYEPNQYYRPWLEANIGQQGRDWDWDVCGTDIDYLEIYFAKKEHATLFELKWP